MELIDSFLDLWPYIVVGLAGMTVFFLVIIALTLLVFFVLLRKGITSEIVEVIMRGRNNGEQGDSKGTNSTLYIYKGRYARGEISKEEYDQIISNELIEPTKGKAKEILDGVLQPDETVYVALKGATGHLIATSQRIIIIKSGFTAGSLAELLSSKSVAKYSSFTYDQILGLELNNGIVSGKMIIAAIAHAADNAIDFTVTDYKKYETAMGKILELMYSF